MQHQRNTDSTWKDFVFELRNYLEGWLEGLEVDDLDKLKDLMVADQLKKRVPFEMSDHCVDEWSKIISASRLSEILDEYENVRGPKRRNFLEYNSGRRRQNEQV